MEKMVPVLLTEDMVASIDIMFSARDKYILSENVFLFGVSASKRSTTSWAALKGIVSTIGNSWLMSCKGYWFKLHHFLTYWTSMISMNNVQLLNGLLPIYSLSPSSGENCTQSY